MTNNFNSALKKLTDKEASALIAPLAAIIMKYETTTSGDPDLRQIVKNYRAALSGNNKKLLWIEPNGTQHLSSQDMLDALLNFTPSTVVVVG